jgi:hypothetical protein
MSASGIVLLNSTKGRKIVKKHCKELGISIELIEDLVGAELEQVGKLRKRGLFESFDELLDQELGE